MNRLFGFRPTRRRLFVSDLPKCALEIFFRPFGSDLAGYVDEALRLLGIVSRNVGLARHHVTVAVLASVLAGFVRVDLEAAYLFSSSY